MQEVRCKKCNKLLAKIDVIGMSSHGVIQIKCPRCGEMNTEKESVKDERDNNIGVRNTRTF